MKMTVIGRIATDEGESEPVKKEENGCVWFWIKENQNYTRCVITRRDLIESLDLKRIVNYELVIVGEYISKRNATYIDCDVISVQVKDAPLSNGCGMPRYVEGIYVIEE